jgi:organic hydroperoxide reductase OsmC/OhrA
MKVSARIEDNQGHHTVTLQTDGKAHALTSPPEPSGSGSSANGGEWLFLALATCYCNALYREAAKRNIRIERVEVEVEGNFGAEGEPARDVVCHAKVAAQASVREIIELMRHTNQVAEIQNTLRAATQVNLGRVEVTKV